MKILLIQPPIKDFYHTLIRSYPLGLLHIASKLDDKFEVKVCNFRQGKQRYVKNNDFEELNDFYKKEKISPFSLFKGYKLYGKAKEEIEEYLKEEKPDLIGISANFSAHFKEIKEIIEVVKKILPNCKVVLGGYHPTLFPEEVLKIKEVDFLIRGEGETPFKLLTQSLFEGKNYENIRGVCFKKNGNLIISDINFEKDIDIIPKRSLINKNEYNWGGLNFSQFLTSRGCPFSCAFCGKIKSSFRKRSLESMEEEIEYLEKEDIKFLSLEDEVLGFDEAFFKETLKLFQRRKFKLSCMNGIYLNVLKKNLIILMLEAGFVKLNLSIVDISKNILNEEKRKFFPLLEKLDDLEEFPLNYEVHFILGLPNQKIDDLINLIIFLSQKRVLLAPSIYYLSPFSLDFKKYYRGEEFKYFRSSALYSPNNDFPPKVLYTFLIISRFINFIKSSIDKYEIKNTMDLLEIDSNEIYKKIIKDLIEKEKFIYFDNKIKKFEEEPVVEEIVKSFFKNIKSVKIKGYKRNSCINF